MNIYDVVQRLKEINYIIKKKYTNEDLYEKEKYKYYEPLTNQSKIYDKRCKEKIRILIKMICL